MRPPRLAAERARHVLDHEVEGVLEAPLGIEQAGRLHRAMATFVDAGVDAAPSGAREPC